MISLCSILILLTGLRLVASTPVPLHQHTQNSTSIGQESSGLTNTTILSKVIALDKELGYAIPFQIDQTLTFKLLLDSIGVVSYIDALGCTNCGNHTTLLSTLPLINDAITFSFNTLLGAENVTLTQSGNVSVLVGGSSANLSFYAATSVDNFTASAAFDGFVGLAQAPSNGSLLPNIVQQLATEGKISAPVLTLQLPSIDSTLSGFALFGNASSVLSNKSSVTLENFTSSGFWDVPATPVVNGKTLFFNDPTRTVRINTRGNEIGIPAKDMEALISTIPEAQSIGGGFALPCNATTNISLDINGKRFTLPPANFVSNITTSTISDLCFARFGTQTDNVWSLGSPFTSSYLISFDYGSNSITIAEP